MNNYVKLSNNVNYFDNIFSCCNNICSLTFGYFFPQCLFGKTYELISEGECFVGCCKIYLLHFLTNIFFSIIGVFKALELFNDNNIENINNCTIHSKCKKYNITELVNNNCTINNTTICPCLREPLIKYCHYEKNLPNTITDYYEFITILSIINLFVYLTINGCFYGHYRTKISKKYNILHNSKCDFWIHFFPCIHQLALCQEYNTVYRIEYEIIYPINTM